MADPHLPTTLVDWLDDLTVRFLLNLPASELSSVPRLCFQVEEAQWFYEDFVRPAVAASGAPPLPSLSLRNFCLMLFQHCPLFNGFSGEQHLKAYEEFLAYKVRVPVRGAIMLDEAMEKVVLVRGWKKGASWSFPRGKINKDEKDLHCAVREVWEETGFDIRAAGLVPDNEDDAKAIDVTMREQHMRLFVFRGVPEDTHFEPKTRKEISKIQWYSIKDLPGFKKHKHGQPQPVDASHSNKFYMVAPFLGHLKKWINQQRRLDNDMAKNISANSQTLATGTEEGGETEEDTAPEQDAGLDARSEELKRLLSIGVGGAAVDTSQAQPERLPSTSADLLAMLQGATKPLNGNHMPQTPFDQINQFPRQPESPHPHHMRQPSSEQHLLPPHFPFSPPHHLEAPGRHSSLPTPQIFGQSHDGFPQAGQALSGHPGMQHHYQVAPQRQSIPFVPHSGLPFGSQNGAVAGFTNQHPQVRPPVQQLPPQMLPPHMQYHSFPNQAPPFNPLTQPQGEQGAIQAGPNAPNPSQLPAPRQLGAEKMKLLDAFRDRSGQAVRPAQLPSGQSKQRNASANSTALLDLFRKPSQVQGSQSAQAAQSPLSPETKPVEPASPTGTDVTVKPTPQRKATLNEITRTLPLSKVKSKSPPVPPETTPQQLMHLPISQPGLSNSTAREQPPQPESARERQLFGPNSPAKPGLGTIIQPTKPDRQAQDHTRRSREFKISGPASQSRNGQSSQNGHRATPSPFTILARPGSSKGGLRSPAPPPSPLRNETARTGFHPQVLRRPKDSTLVDMEQPGDKKDHLLALFGKAASQTTAPSAGPFVETKPSLQERKSSTGDEKNRLLDLFNGSTSAVKTTAPQPPSPPPAPRIEPEQRPLSTRQKPTITTTSAKPLQPQQQNLLLDLFNSKKHGSPMQSPGTPTSPFTLGTPAVEEQIKRLGSLSAVANVAPPFARTESGEQSPREQKDFLLGFLNGVVKKEGSKAGSGIGKN